MTKQEEDRFFEIFGDICDAISIEHLVPVNNSKIGNSKGVNMLGNPMQLFEICPQPFYFMQINPDGKCVLCCSAAFSEYVGDCNKETVVEIWNNMRFNEFRKMHLMKEKCNNPICSKCIFHLPER